MEAAIVPLSELIELPGNPKQHDIGAIHTSVSRFGYLERIIINRTTGHMIAGHGRLETLRQQRQAHNTPPTGIEAMNGDWLVPVDYVDLPEDEETAAAIALNRTTELGGWDDAQLAALLQDLAAKDELLLAASGYDDSDIDNLLFDLQPDNIYTRKIESPIYEPSGEKPTVDTLYDDSSTQRLIAAIDISESLTEDERVFLRIAAQRHTVLNFSRIADYYAHSSDEMRRLMEENALVIVDFNRAIELGFITLTEKMSSLIYEEYPDE